MSIVGHVALTLIAVIVTGRVLGRLLQRVGQPPVIGEILAGICLGPSLLGRFAPEAAGCLIPSHEADPAGHVSTALRYISQLGVVLAMFLVGIELDLIGLRRRAKSLVAISAAGMFLPFVGGLVLAIWLHPRFAPDGIEFSAFSPFLGVALAVTAFPVLARILQDRELTRTPLGQTALGCAAIGDAAAWCALAILAGWVQTRAGAATFVLGGSAIFLAIMALIVRPVLSACTHRSDVLVLAIVGALLSALATEMIGLHALFGAFVFGALIPHESALAKRAHGLLHWPVTSFLMPAFFAYSGLRTEIGLLAGADAWLWCAAIVAVATLGKFSGTFFAARWTGHGLRDAAALGTLMNTRGLMELIVLNAGLELGVISKTLFTMMVLMALITTVTTPPVLAFVVETGPCEADR